MRGFFSAATTLGRQKLLAWAFCGAVFFQYFFPIGLQAQGIEASPPGLQDSRTNKTARSFSVSSPDRLAEWQKHLTVGPGDVFQISLYGQSDSTRTNLAVGPDGRLNYLEARDVMASGLTIDELRAKFEQILTNYYRSSRVVIIPEGYRSKKYFILGNVVHQGMFQLDRPTGIIEAIAKAGGFVNSVEQRNTLLLADLPRSFLIRKKQDGGFERLNLDFEALFLRADLSQNEGLEPDDYLYFPPLDLPEVYVLGEVHRPGIARFVPDLTVMKAIVAQGGFTDISYRQRILVVRGSLRHPQTFVVNASRILSANSLDFKLEARDIVFVSQKPWWKPEELLELAITSFFRAVVVTWSGGLISTVPLF